MQIHYRPCGDDTVAQLKPIIFYCIARFRKGKSTFRIFSYCLIMGRKTRGLFLLNSTPPSNHTKALVYPFQPFFISLLASVVIVPDLVA